MYVYETVEDAFLHGLELLYDAPEVEVRGQKTKELLHHSFTVLNPLQRLVLSKHRNGNIFAQAVETLWMLAGRDDLAFLQHYIPSAPKFSDDGGATWRGAYGPRLRNWVIGHFDGLGSGGVTSVDQLHEVVDKLNADPQTRQAIITLWDPAKDNVEGSKDYPCNNWLHFIIRDNKLHLSVAVRSNDIILGFSHVDFFGWSVLQQMMAHWTNTQIGQLTWYASSFHIYEQHYQKMEDILDAHYKQTGLSVIPVSSGWRIKPLSLLNWSQETLPFSTTFGQLDTSLERIFTTERIARQMPVDITPYGCNLLEHDLKDAFLTACARLLVIYNKLQVYSQLDSVRLTQDILTLLNHIPPCDMRLAAMQYILRKHPGVLEGFPFTQAESDFLFPQ